MRACVIEPVRLTDDSMQPILAEGNVALVWKLRYGIRVPGSGAMLLEWKSPKKGDLVVAVATGDPPANLLRRISAIPGEIATLADGKQIELKKGEYFLLAERKEGVMDSRQFGPVPMRSIIGKVTHTWFSKNPSSPDGSKVESEKSSWRILQPVL